MSSMNKIMDNLWLGDMVGASNKFLLKKNGITHILTVAQGLLPKFPTQFEYKLVNVLDCPSANLKQYWPSCVKFIKDAIASGGTVLVHCFAGVSRSTSTICAYLIQEFGMTFNQALQTCKKARYFVNPNDGFRRQLLQWSRECKSKQAQKVQNPEDMTSLPQKQVEDVKVETKVTAPIQNGYSSYGVTGKAYPMPNSYPPNETHMRASNGFPQASNPWEERKVPNRPPSQGNHKQYGGSPAPAKTKGLIYQGKNVGIASKAISGQPSGFLGPAMGSPYKAPVVINGKQGKFLQRKNF